MHSGFAKTPTRKIGLWPAKPEELQPSGFFDFANEAHKALSHTAARAVKLWRWRIGYRSDRNPIRFSNPSNAQLTVKIGTLALMEFKPISALVLSLPR
jgi:hypothetical protein